MSAIGEVNSLAPSAPAFSSIGDSVINLAFLDDEEFASMLVAADGDMDRMIDEMKRSSNLEVSAASSPTQGT